MKNKRTIMLHKMPNDFPQGEVNSLLLEGEIIESSEFGKRRPSIANGMWQLDNGDWAYREDALFMKNEDGSYTEYKRVSGPQNNPSTKPLDNKIRDEKSKFDIVQMDLF